MKIFYFLTACLVLNATVSLNAADSGDKVIIVYNSRVPESKGVADYYALRRNVPTNHIFGFALTNAQDISRMEFQDSLQRPLARLISERKLWRFGSEIISESNGKPAHVEWRVKESKIRYAVLCYGVPIRITRDPNLKEPVEENMRPEMRRNEAAVDTELALLPCIEQHLPLAGPLGNPVYAGTNAAAFDPTNGILMVTRLDGPSAEIARGLVDKAIQAETDGLWGRAYFDVRNITEPGYKLGDDWIRGAAAICRQLGFETVVDENPGTFPAEFPMSQIAFYCGWYDGTVSGPFARPKVEFMPGAFAYHLHSFSASNIRSATEYWVGPLLAKGATATMGCVNEPYLSGTPDVAVFAARLLYYDMSFGESAYAAQPVLSWQTTIVGDPLYRPFGKPQQQLQEELAQKRSKLIEWAHLRLVDLNLANGNRANAVAPYLEQLDTTKQSAVLTEKLADLYEAMGKPSSAIDTYERALRLDTSPQQRVRLRLTLEEKLAALDRNAEASDQFEKLLAENPDYPNKLALYQKLLPLAEKLGKHESVAKYSDLIRQLTPPPPPPAKKT